MHHAAVRADEAVHVRDHRSKAAQVARVVRGKLPAKLRLPVLRHHVHDQHVRLRDQQGVDELLPPCPAVALGARGIGEYANHRASRRGLLHSAENGAQRLAGLLALIVGQAQIEHFARPIHFFRIRRAQQKYAAMRQMIRPGQAVPQRIGIRPRIREAELEAGPDDTQQQAAGLRTRARIDGQIVGVAPQLQQQRDGLPHMPGDLSRQAENLSYLKPVGEQHPRRFAATDQVDLGARIERLDLGQQGADQHGIAKAMIGPADQHAVDAARRQLAGLAQLPAHGGKQTAKK